MYIRGTLLRVLECIMNILIVVCVFVLVSEHTATFLVTTENESVYFAVRSECLTVLHVILSL